MNRFLLLALPFLIVGAASAADDSWKSRLQPANVGSFPNIRPFSGEFRFGWSGIDAASAKARLTTKGGEMNVTVEGGTTGVARTLWQISAKHNAIIKSSGLKSVSFTQSERYAKRAVYTQAVFKPDGLWRKRQVIPDPGKTPRWKLINVEPVRDIISAMFFIRSQKLETGEKVGIVAFPGDSPFLVEVEVLAREQIRIAGQPRKVIKLDFKLQRLVLEDDEVVRLEPNKKFRSGTVWLSDDADRVPLRAEVEIFIGYVFGELTELSFDKP